MSKTSPLRTIVIDGVSYLWRVRSLGPRFVLLSVWRAQKPRAKELRVRVRFDDPWLNYGPMITAPPERVREVFVLEPLTPARVRQIILAALQIGWRPAERGAPLTLELLDDTTLQPLTLP